ncbi:MAG: pentapeptide repeat-containing protein [Bacteroidia bacterium]|nr:pentapeptide repeat-containing protein [Bacteroidia bacterium]
MNNFSNGWDTIIFEGDIVIHIGLLISSSQKNEIGYLALTEDIDLSRAIFKGQVTFRKTSFRTKTFFGGYGKPIKRKFATEFQKRVKFLECEFKDKVYFNFAEFKEKVSFNDCIFEANCYFQNTIFQKGLELHNTTFHQLVDFYKANFHGKQRFNKTDFLAVTIFSEARFFDEVQFQYHKIGSNTSISFQNTKFEQSLDLARSNFNTKISVWGIELNPKNIIPSTIELYGDIEGVEDKDEKVALQRIRESYRRIKQELKGEGNAIEAINFGSYEMKVYERELSKTGFFEKWNDKIILLFNRLTNNHGKSWGRGVLFTIITSILLFATFSIMAMRDGNLEFAPTWEGLRYTLKHICSLLDVTNFKFEPIEGYNPWWLGIFLFISKILIGIGYFKTIQAFRKFARN